MLIEITALDTLFFRDGKPFSMGQETWADSVFPPSPSVFYGFLRTIYFSNCPNDLPKANEDNDPTKELKIKSIYYSYNTYSFYPAPLDCVKEKKRIDNNETNEEKNNKKIYLLSLEKDKNFITNCPTEYILISESDKKFESTEGLIFSHSELKKYLNLKETSYSYIALKDLTIDEPKVGIGRDNITHTTQEGALYRVPLIRCKNISFILDIEWDADKLELLKEGIGKLGGDNKIVKFKELKEQPTLGIPSLDNSNRFKLYLLTPAIFRKGWLPSWIDINKMEGIYNGLKLKLLTAAIGKYRNIGGFDIKANKPKVMRKAVPAGSVYYFELLEGDKDKVIETFHNKSISEFNSNEGFGINLVGRIDK